MASRNNRQAVRNGGSGLPWWVLILIGIVIGAFLMAMVAQRGLIPSLRRNDQPKANPNAVAQAGSSPGIAASSSGPASSSQFDFYKVLPEKEVVIPNAELSAMAKAEQQKAAAANGATTAAPPAANAPAAGAPATTASATAGGYVLQVGAFPSVSDAEAVKAKLALQGFTAHVQAVSLDGQTWNRVRIGPFPSATELQKVQKQLAGAGFNAIPLKEK
ncbi:MAG TPA: SPOR domain-containing protein [Rhodanobacteraceae bacterium]|nr:SPOR domain-containing protein [Rhodanobacteraceae bacterium]